jgi:hypothetical protein
MHLSRHRKLVPVGRSYLRPGDGERSMGRDPTIYKARWLGNITSGTSKPNIMCAFINKFLIRRTSPLD